ncbi:MAG: helix-turn-helix transcriptional regulator [Clostridia bacterium]|nr:helix-turn-helix transcriptional regulator [Clostridia bacterium]
MFFEKENLQFSLLSLTELHQKDFYRRNAGRRFDAVSFRYHADTDLVTEKGVRHLTDNFICFVPRGINYDRIGKTDDLIAVNCYIGNYKPDDIECFCPKEPEKIAKLFSEISVCWNEKSPGYTHRCTAIFYQILAECCAQTSEKESARSKIQSAVDYLHANFASCDLTIGQIAARSFVSEVYFRKLFKEEFGIPPQKYIANLRLKRAIELIGTGDYALKEIALMSGYGDYKYFSTEFKRITGVSPSAYR